MFLSSERGREVISQKFWTALTAASIETAAERLGDDVETMAQEDSMTLRLRIRVPDHTFPSAKSAISANMTDSGRHGWSIHEGTDVPDDCSEFAVEGLGDMEVDVFGRPRQSLGLQFGACSSSLEAHCEGPHVCETHQCHTAT